MRASALLLAGLALTACSGGDGKSQPKTAADQIAESAGPAEHFESTRGQFTMDFPLFWRGNYKAIERNDTTAGAKMTVEFVFTPPAGATEKEQTLFLVRVFPSKAWKALTARPGRPIAIEAGSKGDDIFGLSFAPNNPYTAGTPVAAKFDSLMLSVMKGPPAVKLSAK